MNSGAEGAENCFQHLKMVNFFFHHSLANDDFSEPPQRADSKSPGFTFCRILGPGHLQSPGVSLGRILGGPSIEPFFGGGGGLASGLFRPQPPDLKARPPLVTLQPPQGACSAPWYCTESVGYCGAGIGVFPTAGVKLRVPTLDLGVPRPHSRRRSAHVPRPLQGRGPQKQGEGGGGTGLSGGVCIRSALHGALHFSPAKPLMRMRGCVQGSAGALRPPPPASSVYPITIGTPMVV